MDCKLQSKLANVNCKLQSITYNMDLDKNEHRRIKIPFDQVPYNRSFCLFESGKDKFLFHRSNRTVPKIIWFLIIPRFIIMTNSIKESVVHNFSIFDALFGNGAIIFSQHYLRKLFLEKIGKLIKLHYPIQQRHVISVSIMTIMLLQNMFKMLFRNRSWSINLF